MKRSIGISVILSFILWPLSGHAAYEAVEIPDGGSIHGKVTFAGDPPTLEPIPVSSDQEFCGESLPSAALLVDADTGGIKHSVVFLEEISQGKKPELAKPLLDNVGCNLTPHVMAMMKGGNLSLKNSDQMLHNVHAMVQSQDRKHLLFNMAVPPAQGKAVSRTVRKSGLVSVTCDSHPHMLSYIYVFDHPYFDVTDEEGTFSIDGVPPGRYRLTVWHESWKVIGYDQDNRPLYDSAVVLTQEVEVPANQEVQVNFQLQ